MKKWIKWGIIVAVVVIFVSSFVGTYNSLIDRRTEVEKTWSDVEAEYQRRLDLLPRLVQSVKAYANHEQQTFIKTIEQRAAATQVQIKFEDIDDKTLAKYQASQGELGTALGRLMAIGEAYPDLKASANFINLQDELSSTENRVRKARSDFNKSVKEYNSYLQKFPRNIIAGMFNFTPKSFFAAEPSAAQAPDLDL